jgi:predicted DNA-binding transcriptional regulator YafY
LVAVALPAVVRANETALREVLAVLEGFEDKVVTADATGKLKDPHAATTAAAANALVAAVCSRTLPAAGSTATADSLKAAVAELRDLGFEVDTDASGVVTRVAEPAALLPFDDAVAAWQAWALVT